MKKALDILHGNCLDEMDFLADAGVQFDAVITDPPYHLASIVKRFGKEGSAPAKSDGPTGVYKRASTGFMGKLWDGGEIAFDPATWRRAYDLLKPGGHLLAFGAPKNVHRLTCAIEDAGFEIRNRVIHLIDPSAAMVDFLDSLTEAQADAFVRLLEDQEGGEVFWSFGTGFPKSHDISKAIDAKLLTGGSAPTNIRRRDMGDGYRPHALAGTPGYGDGRMSRGADTDRDYKDASALQTDAARQWGGWGSDLKPAYEPVVVARKPLVGTLAENVLKYGTGGLNIDGCRVTAETGGRPLREVAPLRPDVTYNGNALAGRVDGTLQSSKAVGTTDMGRFPANLTHDGSDVVLAAFPEAPGQQGDLVGHNKNRKSPNGIFGEMAPAKDALARGDTGNAGRFFYSAKARTSERPWHCTACGAGGFGKRPDCAEGRGKDCPATSHPTVKPIELMRWLVRLVTPPGGLVLDPFAGTGSTGEAALLEGMRAILIEREAEYIPDIRRRAERAQARALDDLL